jgi:hypothetical protein
LVQAFLKKWWVESDFKAPNLPLSNNTTFRLKDVKELTHAAFGKITKDVWTKAEEHVVSIEKEYCKENCIDRSVIEPSIINFCDDDSDDDTG